MQRLGGQVVKPGIRAFLLAALLAALAPAALPAQEEAEAPRDALDRGIPWSSMRGFLLAASDQDFGTAAEYLDLRNLPPEVSNLGGQELARQLNLVLSRTMRLQDYDLDTTPSGRQGDGLPDFRDELGRIPGPDGDVILYLQHVPREDGVMIWKISNQSVAEIPSLYAFYAPDPWVEAIRQRLPANMGFLGLELYKWVIMLAVGLLAWPVFHLIGALLSRLVLGPDHPMFPLVYRALTRPFVALAVVVLMGLTIRRLGLSAMAQKYADARTIGILVVVWVIWSLIGLVQVFKRQRLMQQGREGAAKLLRPMSNLLRLLVLLIGVLFWLSNIGVNISTVLAGLGVGGLALALALQKPIEDLMGALTLFSQQPVRVGDFCRYADVTGTVEEIGLRTTRIRTLGNTVVCVPNARIAHSEIENYSARQKFYYKPELRLRYDTSPEQIRSILAEIREMLASHPRVLAEDGLRVRFTDFSSDAILVKVHSYVDATSIAEFLEIAENLNLRIMEIVESHSVSFALPGRMIYGTPGGQARGA